MEELPRALAARLPPEGVRLKARVTGVTRDGAGWRLGLADGFAATADAVIIATESHQAGRMLRYTDPALAHLLDGIPYASSAAPTVASASPTAFAQVKKPPPAFSRRRRAASGSRRAWRYARRRRSASSP